MSTDELRRDIVAALGMIVAVTLLYGLIHVAF
jgi:hypothetical protein